MAKFKIAVRLITGQTFSYKVDTFWVEEGTLICFVDKKINKVVRFDSRNCQIEEEVEE